MIVPTDKDYIDTKLVKQGVKNLSPLFKELIDWIKAEFKLNAINIYFDILDHNSRPRLNVVLDEYTSANTIRDRIGNYAKEKQEKQEKIKNKFKELLIQSNETEYRTENLLVIFSAFNSIARAEANGKITESDLQNLKSKYATSEIWEISKFGSSTTLFFYTDNEIELKKDSIEIKQLKEEYYELLKKHDEFELVNESNFLFSFDSKENFDNKYESNWYYYYK